MNIKTTISKTNLIYIIFGGLNFLSLVLLILLPLFNVTNFNFAHIIMNSGVFLVSFAPILFEKIFKIKLNYLTILAFEIFVFFSATLGTFWGAYNAISFYDILMHSSSGFLIAIISFQIFNLKSKTQLSTGWLFILIFSISMCAGALWELWEFFGDLFFGFNSQHYALDNSLLVGQDALRDTMVDFICNTIGATAGSFVVVFQHNKTTSISNKKNLTL